MYASWKAEQRVRGTARDLAPETCPGLDGLTELGLSYAPLARVPIFASRPSAVKGPPGDLGQILDDIDTDSGVNPANLCSWGTINLLATRPWTYRKQMG